MAGAHLIWELNIYQARKNDFLHLGLAVVHQSYPRHLIAGFQFLCHPSSFHHLREHPVHPLAGGLINVQQMGGKFSAASQLTPQLMSPFL